MPVQQQSNGVNCGVFALAFCFHILSENANPVGIFFDESKLRHHLLHCLTADLISPFPKYNGQGIKFRTCKDRETMVEIFCTCRMPWIIAENNIYAKQMVECSKCGEWFHRMYERIPEDICMKQNSKIELVCRSCSNSKWNPSYPIISFANLNFVSQWEEQQKTRKLTRMTEWYPFFKTILLPSMKFNFFLRIRHDKPSWTMTWPTCSSDLDDLTSVNSQWLKLWRHLLPLFMKDHLTGSSFNLIACVEI